MASFRCYDNSDVIAFLIMTNFHLYLIKLWWQFFQMFVYGDVVMLRIGRYWPWKTVSVSNHLHMPVRPMLLHSMALVSFRLYVRKNLGNLWEFFGQMVYCPPWQKISRTPMVLYARAIYGNTKRTKWKNVCEYTKTSPAVYTAMCNGNSSMWLLTSFPASFVLLQRRR